MLKARDLDLVKKLIRNNATEADKMTQCHPYDISNTSILAQVVIPPEAAAAMQLVIAFMGVGANALLLTAHVRDPLKTLKTSSSAFLLNIAIVDLLVSLTWMIKSILTLKCGCPKTYNFDDISQSVQNVLIETSFPSYLSLAIERLCSIAYPLWHRVHMSSASHRCWLTLIWFFTIAFVFILKFFSTSTVMEFAFYGSVGAIFLMSTQFVYLATYISLRKQRKRLLSGETTDSATNRRLQETRLRSEKNFMVTTAIVCSILAVTLLPMLVNALLFTGLVPETVTKVSPKVRNVISCTIMILVTINFAINPFIYVWRLPKYRKTFKKLYCSKN